MARMSPSTTIDGGESKAATQNWRDADEIAVRWASSSQPLTLQFMNQLNQAINKGETGLRGPAGQIRNYDLFPIGHQIREYPKGSDVMPMMQDFLKWYAGATQRYAANPVFIAASAYQRLVSIHPYPDGNGRTTRLVMDAILMRMSYPPAVFSGSQFVQSPGFGTYEINDFDVACYGLLTDQTNIPPGFAEESVVNAELMATKLLQDF